ncbi:RNA polymerase sigma factor [Candidatus Sulfopaludibacter sp. SbA3]|nr:RNA polymerase sigma factor [Candidatus Sulfopaludibacter sp. SbA3]
MDITSDRAKREASLVSRLRGRDPLALADLYDQFGTYVFRVAYCLVRDADAAENLTQETFLYLWNRIAAFDSGRGTLTAWVGLVARSRALDYVRSAEFRMARRTAPLEDARPLANPSSVECRMAQVERIRLLEGPWQRLKQCERQTLRLAYYSGLSQPEIAERLNRPLGTIKTWMRSGLRSLRAELEGADAF